MAHCTPIFKTSLETMEKVYLNNFRVYSWIDLKIGINIHIVWIYVYVEADNWDYNNLANNCNSLICRADECGNQDIIISYL